MPQQILKQDLVHPELSYNLIGCAYEIFNELGFGHPEKIYQRAFAVQLKTKNIAFKEQVYHPLKFKDEIIGKFFFDFLVDEKVIIELKKDNRFSKQHIDQVNEYLRISGIKLAILINFAPNGVIYKRLVNIIKNQ
jgi:GxxExxY protein